VSRESHARGGIFIPQLEGLEPGLVVEWLYELIGTGGVLQELENLHRRDAQRRGETPERPGDHYECAWQLGGARRTLAPQDERLQRGRGR